MGVEWRAANYFCIEK